MEGLDISVCHCHKLFVIIRKKERWLKIKFTHSLDQRNLKIYSKKTIKNTYGPTVCGTRMFTNGWNFLLGRAGILKYCVIKVKM